MVLILILVLLIGTCCQSESLEKSLDTILDELIDETVTSNEKANLNDSRIIYVKSDNGTRRQLANAVETKLDPLPSDAYEDFDDLIHKIEDSERKETIHTTNIIDSSPSVGEILVQIGSTESDFMENKGENKHFEFHNRFLKPKLHDGISQNYMSKYTAEIGSKLLHNYPEIVIDQITASENRKKSNSIGLADLRRFSAQKQKEVEDASKTLDTVLKILLNKFPIKSVARTSTSSEVSQDNDANLISKSGFVSNDQSKDLIKEVPVMYSPVNDQRYIEPIPAQYGNIMGNHVIHKTRIPYVDPNLHLMRWSRRSGNILPNRMLRHFHVFPKPLPRNTRVYRRPYYHPYHLL